MQTEHDDPALLRPCGARDRTDRGDERQSRARDDGNPTGKPSAEFKSSPHPQAMLLLRARNSCARPEQISCPARTKGNGAMRSNAVVVLVSAVVALAVGLGLGALLFGGNSSHTSPSSTTSKPTAADTRPIALPASLGGFHDVVAAEAAKGAKASVLDSRKRAEATVTAATTAAYSQAFGGASAAYHAYADSTLLKLSYVIAVRAAAPGLTVGPVQDAKYLGLATPSREVKAVGSVQCQIDWSPPTVAGQTPPDSSELIDGCQRTGPGLSVFVNGAGFRGRQGLNAMVGLANAAWSAASG
jgi:hypothetical protein